VELCFSAGMLDVSHVMFWVEPTDQLVTCVGEVMRGLKTRNEWGLVTGEEITEVTKRRAAVKRAVKAIMVLGREVLRLNYD